MKNMSSYSMLAAATLICVGSAMGSPTPMTSVDTPTCDVLAIPLFVDELGNRPPFPVDEWLDSSATSTTLVACPLTDDSQLPNVLVSITNRTAGWYPDVWYVKDEETFFSNVDGLAGAQSPTQSALKIDAIGNNIPLVSESSITDGVWAPGETWSFILQDYSNSLSLPASAFDSIGVPSGSPPSSGSIIVPEPALFALSGLLVPLMLRRRR